MSTHTSHGSEAFFRLVVENVLDFAVFATDAGGRIVSWNPGVERLLGYGEAEFVGRHASLIFTPEDREGRVPELEMETALREGRAEDRRWHSRKDGSRFWANGLLMLLRDEGGAVQGFAKILRDDTEGKRAEDQLRRQLGLTETITGSLLEGLHVLDREGRITFTNRAAQEMLGWASEELLGKNQHEMIHSRLGDGTPHPAAECPVIAVLETGEPLRDYETVYTRRDGSRFPVLCTSAPLVADGRVTGAVMTFHDISARRQAEERLRASEARFREMMRQSPLSTYVTDPEGRVLDVNPSFVELWGLRLEDLAGYNARHDRQAEALGLQPYIERAYAGEAVEMPTVRYDPARTESIGEGQARWVRCFAYPIKDEGGRVREVVITHEDVTERVRAERALRESEEQYRVIAETASDALLTIDAESTILVANPAVERVFGYAPDELVGRPLTILMPDYLRHLHQAGISRYMETGRKHISWGGVELPGLHKSGEEIPLEVSFGEFVKGGQRFFTGIARDVSARRQAEREREHLLSREQQARREAEEANRLKDEFLATLSHELRTPLTAILGWAHMLRSGQLDEEAAARALETIERNARAQTQLTGDILDVSRIITGKLRLEVGPVDLAAVAESVVESMRPAADAKDIRLQLLLDSRGGLISGDANRLRQVIWNLVSNAIKFTPKRGRVQLRLERVNSHVELAVSDTGQGISPEFLPHVFDRFRQADSGSRRAHGGLGLGLSIVRQLVEMHGGSVRAESEGEGLGATFTVNLPLLPVRAERRRAVRDQTAPAPPASAECPPELHGLRVLVVEDEEDSRELIAAVLGRCGAEVSRAASAREGLELYESIKPDVLVSDIGMPGEDGYDLIRRVRALPAERGGRTPAVALTAYARAEDRVRSLLAGFQVHLPKPVEANELVAVVASLAGRTGKT